MTWTSTSRTQPAAEWWWATTWYAGNDQWFFSRKRLDTMEDYEGLKIRSHGTTISDLIRGLGADAQFVAFVEVYTALERGILDAGVTGGSAGFGQR